MIMVGNGDMRVRNKQVVVEAETMDGRVVLFEEIISTPLLVTFVSGGCGGGHCHATCATACHATCATVIRNATCATVIRNANCATVIRVSTTDIRQGI